MTELVYPSFYDAYLSTQSNPILYNKRLQTSYGIIEFHRPRTSDEVAIYYIQVRREYRRNGLVRTFLTNLLEDPTVRSITILAVSNVHLESLLQSLTYYDQEFVNQGGDWILEKSSEYTTY